MKRRLPIRTENGDIIIAEVEDNEGTVPRGPVKTGLKERAESLLESAANLTSLTFEALIDLYLRTNINAFCTSLERLDNPPESAELSFGLKLTADAGAAICKAGSEATYNVKLTWRGLDDKSKEKRHS